MQPADGRAGRLRRNCRDEGGRLLHKGGSAIRKECTAAARPLAGGSGPLHTPTGSGKTLAVAGVSLLEALARAESAPATKRRMRAAEAHPLRLLWITPLRALAADTTRALREPAAALGLD